MAVETDSTSVVEAQLSRIARSGTVNVAGAALASILNFLTVVLITKAFDQQTAGMLFSATSVFLILLGAAVLGADSGLARFISLLEATGRSRDIYSFIRVARWSVGGAAVILAAIGILLAGWLAPLIGLSGSEGPQVLMVLAAALPLAALGDLSLAGTRAFGTVRSTVLVEKLLRPTLQPLLVMAAWLAGGGILLLTVSWVIPYALAALVSWWVFSRLLTRRRHSPRTQPVSARPVIRHEFWSFTWARGIARISQIILQRADIVLVASFLSVREAAVYTAATRFVALGQFGSNAIAQVLQPRFSQLLAREQYADARDVFKTATSWSMAITWPLYTVTAAGAGFYLLIFGANYAGAGAYAVVVTMSIAMLLSVAAGPLDIMLLMAGGSKSSLGIALCALAVDIGLCLWLIPSLGISGAAVAWAASVVVKNALTYVRVKSTLAIGPLSRGAALVALANFTCLGGPLLVVSLVTERTVWIFAIVLIAGVLAYAALLWMWRVPLKLSAFRSLRSVATGRSGRNSNASKRPA